MTNRFAGLAFAALTSLIALPVYGQSGNWRVDSAHSAARISVEDKTAAGSGITLLLGGAGVSGSLRLDKADASKSAAEFTIYPVGSPAYQASDVDDPDAALSTILSFRSEQASWTEDGRLKVTGLLTVTQVKREAVLDGNEAYSGPVYVDRMISQASREESFVFTVPSLNAPKSGTADVSTSLVINREDFPELVNAVLSTNWTPALQDKNCEAPLTFSEDYSGTLCTGSDVIVPSDTRTAVAASEDYPGNQADSAEPGNFVTVALQLHLAQETTQLSAKTGQ